MAVLFVGEVATAQDSLRTISCPVVVRDSNGNVVHDLQLEDFDSSLPLASISHDSRPRRIAVVLDASGSVLSNPATHGWKLAKEMIDRLVRQGGENTLLALLIFNSEVTETIDFSTDNNAVLARLQKMSSDPHDATATCKSCRTALYDALYHSISLFNGPPQADALLVITDGEDNVSKVSYKKLSVSLLASGIRLFAVVVANRLPYRNKTPEELIPATSDLEFVVERSGGSLFGPMQWMPDRQMFHIAAIADRVPLDEALRHFYAGMLDSDLVSVHLPVSCQQNCGWKLRLSKASRHKLQSAHVEYPATLTSPTVEQRK